MTKCFTQLWTTVRDNQLQSVEGLRSTVSTISSLTLRRQHLLSPRSASRTVIPLHSILSTPPFNITDFLSIRSSPSSICFPSSTFVTRSLHFPSFDPSLHKLPSPPFLCSLLHPLPPHLRILYFSYLSEFKLNFNMLHSPSPHASISSLPSHVLFFFQNFLCCPLFLPPCPDCNFSALPPSYLLPSVSLLSTLPPAPHCLSFTVQWPALIHLSVYPPWPSMCACVHVCVCVCEWKFFFISEGWFGHIASLDQPALSLSRQTHTHTHTHTHRHTHTHTQCRSEPWSLWHTIYPLDTFLNTWLPPNLITVQFNRRVWPLPVSSEVFWFVFHHPPPICFIFVN